MLGKTRCCDCDHWTKATQSEGHCKAPVPVSVDDGSRHMMLWDDGDGCPMFKRPAVMRNGSAIDDMGG